MNKEQIERYSRHILLPQIGQEGQRRLLDSRVLIVGMGGLGSPIAMYLAASGVGRLVLSDFDQVELSNLQRQVIHASDEVGKLKVESAQRRLQALNPGVTVTTKGWTLDDDELLAEITQADVVVDACDNFESRFAMNAVSVRTGTPLVSGAALRMEGQVTVFEPAREDSPCYRCLYADESVEGEVCAQVGVLAPMLGIIGSVQATETLKLLIGMGSTLTGRLLILDALHMEWQSMTLPKDPGCPVCGAAARMPRPSNQIPA